MPTLPNVDEAVEEAAEEEATQAIARTRHRHRRTVADLRREIRELNAEMDDLEQAVATLEALRSKPPKPKKMRVRRTRKSERLPASFVALASDWHTCEVVTPKQTNLMNRHNLDVGTERAWEWSKGVITMLKREQETCDIETFVLWLGGDFMVNESLHYKSERSVYQSPHEEAQIVRDLLAQIIQHFRDELDVPRIVIPTSWGNHDRSTAKMVPGHGGEYSYIQQVYRDLASWFAGNDSIEFRISESEWEVCDVHGYGILFHHGHMIGYGAGQAGLGFPLHKAISSKRGHLNFKTLCVGHFHQRGTYHGGAAFTNGCLVGPNGYSMDNKYQPERPAQVAFLIDHSRQEVSNYFSIWGD